MTTSPKAAGVMGESVKEKCGKPAASFIPRMGMYFSCVLEPGHEGRCQQGGSCFKHGNYVGERCPQWPNCIDGAIDEPSAQPHEKVAGDEEVRPTLMTAQEFVRQVLEADRSVDDDGNDVSLERLQYMASRVVPASCLESALASSAARVEELVAGFEIQKRGRIKRDIRIADLEAALRELVEEIDEDFDVSEGTLAKGRDVLAKSKEVK